MVVASPPRQRLGCTTPRIYTPPLVTGPPGDCGCGCALTSDTSLGFTAVKFAEKIGVKLYPWQRWLLIHALELRADGGFRFRNVVVLVARQNGKSTLSQVLSLFCLYVLGLGLVLGTAQDLDTAEEVWQGALDLIEETPALKALADRPVLRNGAKTIRLKTGERYRVKAASRRAGRGLSGDLILLDELREHTSWDAWGAITKTTMARPNAQVWALSNAGDAASVVLRYLRKMAHASLGDPDGVNAAEDPAKLLEQADVVDAEELAVDEDDSLGIFEWSAPPGCAVDDRSVWPQANPSLGYAITERTIASAAKTDPEWVFRTEVLCQWSDGTLEGPFPAGSWESGMDEDSETAAGAELRFCVDVSWDRTRAHVAVAGLREDGLSHVEVVASRAGTDWVVGWFADPAKPERRAKPVAVQTGSPAASLIDELLAAEVEVFEWKGNELGRSCGHLYDHVRDNKLRHRPQPILDVAAATAVTRPLQDAWVWDRRKSPIDAAPLVAVTGALWLIAARPDDSLPTPDVF